MHGDHELRCLNMVKDALFYKDDQTIQNTFISKTYFDVSDDECKNEMIGLVNSHKFYFGLLEHDQAEFENILRTAHANPNASHFPDFIFENGFIEHFRITSSCVTRKGAAHAREESKFRRKVDVETRDIKSEWSGTPSFDEMRSKVCSFSNPVHTHEFLVESFKRNWEHHLESHKKYNGSKEIGIFMVEYLEFALAMFENIYHNWIDGMSQGDMRGQEQFNEYRLSRDKNLLEYIYQFKDEVQYVIFLNYARIEVIRTENIPYIIKLLPWDYVIYPLQVTTVASVHNISVPGDPRQEGDTDDKT